MNILFFLTPKSDVAYINEDDTIRQAMEKMANHGYTAVPLLSKEGKYKGTITEGDLLWSLRGMKFPTESQLEKSLVTELHRSHDNSPVHIQASMESLLEKTMNQNFVPVVDDHSIFIGIVTRKDIISYLAKEAGLKGADE